MGAYARAKFSCLENFVIYASFCFSPFCLPFSISFLSLSFICLCLSYFFPVLSFQLSSHLYCYIFCVEVYSSSTSLFLFLSPLYIFFCLLFSFLYLSSPFYLPCFVSLSACLFPFFLVSSFCFWSFSFLLLVLSLPCSVFIRTRSITTFNNHTHDDRGISPWWVSNPHKGGICVTLPSALTTRPLSRDNLLSSRFLLFSASYLDFSSDFFFLFL